MVSSGECVTHEVGKDKLESPDSGTNALQQTNGSNIHSSQSDQAGGTPSIKSEKDSHDDTGVHISQSEQRGNASSMVSKKTLLTAPQLPGTEGSSPVARERASEDGYNWRKYGQKLVKGNEFVRSYYKCTHPNCQVKKQFERSHDGKMVDTVYFGQHDHPQPLNVPLAVGFVVSVVEEKPDNASPTIVKGDLIFEDKSLDAKIQTPCQIEPRDDSKHLAVIASEDMKGTPSKSNRMQNIAASDDHHLTSKRRKKESCNADATQVEKPTSESRMVIKTLSEVDIVNDGYRWRKYGQKLVKGNPNPRSYYRCSHPGCPVKKHVERASHDAKLVITTYEGRHDHDLPPTRTVTHNTTGVNVQSADHNDKSGTKVEESESSTNVEESETVAHARPGEENKSSEPLNGESRTKSQVSVTVSVAMIDEPISGPKSGSNEQQNGVVGTDMIVHNKSSSQSASNEQPSSIKLEAKSENKTVCIDKMLHITSRSEHNFDEQRMPNAEPVQS